MSPFLRKVNCGGFFRASVVEICSGLAPNFSARFTGCKTWSMFSARETIKHASVVVAVEKSLGE